MRKFSIWHVPELNDKCIRKLKNELGISHTLAQILCGRGITDTEQARNFLWGGLEALVDPYLVPGMDVAVTRLEQARQEKQKVLIYGDYDVDGICSVAVLKECLDHLGIDNAYYIPSRFSEGYGLNREAVMLAGEQGYQIMVTVDCGVSSQEEVALANHLGLDVIITDHHQPPDKLPPALAVVNPKLSPDSPLRDLAGAGVVFKLVSALCARLDPTYDLTPLLDLVALATVADIVPLLGENRILVRTGLGILEKAGRPGLRALLEDAGLRGKKLNYWHVGFIVAPRLNAAGRIGEATTGVELVMTKDPDEGIRLARFLNQQNRRRQEIEAMMLEQARREVAATVDLEKEKVILVGGEGWHLGVIGIVASRIAEVFQRPAILVAWEGDLGRGSGRSVPGFDLYQALQRCDHLLMKFGGHQQAAGITLERTCFEELRQELNHVADRVIREDDLLSRIHVDAEVAIEDVNLTLLQDIETLEPFGEGNPVPNLVLRNAEVINPILVGKNSEHLKFWVDGNGRRLEAIAFKMAEFNRLSYSTELFDMVFQPFLDDYNGDRKLVLNIKDIKPSRVADGPHNNYRGFAILSHPKFVSLEEEIRYELQQSHPVLLVYPTLRCLEKHLLSVKSSFPARILVLLHGKQLPETQARGIHELVSGSKRLFLTTAPFFKYYIKNSPMPVNLQSIHFIWPEDEVFNLSCPGTEGLRIVNHQPLAINRLTSLKRLEGWEGLQGALIYANRAGTVRQLFQYWGKPSLEAGITDVARRRKARLEFLSGQSDVLISDARFGSNLPVLPQVEKLVFADSPCGLCEAFAFIAQAGEEREVEVSLAFSPADLDFNQQYLERTFPGFETVKSFLGFFKAAGKSSITINSEVINELTHFLGRKVEAVELNAVLHILAGLDLCRIKSYKGKVQLLFSDNRVGKSNIYDAPYFLEGVAEKESYRKWREVCESRLGW